MDDRTSLARLTAENSPHRAELVTLVLEHTLSRPWGEVVDAEWISRRVASSLALAGRDPHLRSLVIRIVEDVRAELAEQQEPPREHIPAELVDGALHLVGQPWTPSEDLTFRLINHGALRSMLKEVLTGAITRFANRARSLDDGMLGGLGTRAVKRGRGLLGGGLGAAAGNLVGAVRGEVEAALEGRIKDHVKQATEDAIRTIARWLADPAHADTLASMRVAAVEALLDTPTARLVSEVDSFDPADTIDVIFGAIRALAERDDLREQLQPVVSRAWTEVSDQTLGGWLDHGEARDSWMEAMAPVLDAELRHLIASKEFTTWWQRLHSA